MKTDTSIDLYKIHVRLEKLATQKPGNTVQQNQTKSLQRKTKISLKPKQPKAEQLNSKKGFILSNVLAAFSFTGGLNLVLL